MLEDRVEMRKIRKRSESNPNWNKVECKKVLDM